MLALVFASGGCLRIPGSGGAITDRWPAMTEPAGWLPAAGVCYQDFLPVLRGFPVASPECTQWHRSEIVHTGQIADGGPAAPPKQDSPAYRKAWAECDTKTTEYLGGPWRERRIKIGVALPTDSAWEGGARWFACQASVLRRMVGSVIQVKFGLKGKFDSEPELVHGCVQVTDGSTGDWIPKRCDEPHNAEFVGTFGWEASRAEAEAQLRQSGSRLHRKCRDTIAAFAGASVRTGTYVWLPSVEDWKAGDSGIRCYYWLEDKTASRSLRGVGRAGWPLR